MSSRKASKKAEERRQTRRLRKTGFQNRRYDNARNDSERFMAAVDWFRSSAAQYAKRLADTDGGWHQRMPGVHENSAQIVRKMTATLAEHAQWMDEQGVPPG